MTSREIYRLESRGIYVFFPCLVVNCLIYQGEEENKKTTSFLNGFAFVDPNLLSLEGPNYKEVLF